MNDNRIKKLTAAALLAAMTCIATMIIKIPTPTMGYIHLGDGFVLLCGILLGPAQGALAAGIGSMLSDILSGYASYAIPTLVIKALTALVAGALFRSLRAVRAKKYGRTLAIIIGGIAGEAVMVAGYFLYETAMAAASSGAINAATIAAGVTSAAAGVPFNIVQGVVGILLGVLLMPILAKVPDIRTWIGDDARQRA